MVVRMMAAFFNSLTGPRLYRMYYREGSSEVQRTPGGPTTYGFPYESNSAETIGDFGVSYILPIGVLYCVWQRKFQLLLYLGALIVSSYLLRGVGRAVNPSYLAFLRVLSRATSSLTTENMEALQKFDFEFTHWPINFSSNVRSTGSFSSKAGQSQVRDTSSLILSTPCWLLGWLLSHTLGIRLVYPGLLVSGMLRSTLEDGRAKQIVMQQGLRKRVQSADGCTLDTIFFDRRRTATLTGQHLVICFEGNAGFYEIGMLGTPLDVGYSVLGFNTPGFAGSTGMPYPSSVLNAAEAMFDYATSELGFKEQDIIVYAWSIGGYPATHLAGSHPNIKGLILDATFDDVLPLALSRMPGVLHPIVKSMIRNHIDLRVAQELRQFPGPFRLIRRTEDEIIADPPGISTNRGNFLLIDVIRTRYPNLLNEPEVENALTDWLSKPHDSRTSVSVVEMDIPKDISGLSTVEKCRLVIFIAEKLLTDYKTTHCVPLQPSIFQLPWTGPKKGYTLNM